MSWYTSESNLSKSGGTEAHWITVYKPGDSAPVSGIYRCLGCKKEITANAKDPFPPQNHHQHTMAQGSIRWKLNVRSNTEGA